MDSEDKYHFISDNPSIYILTSRLESLFNAIDDERDAFLQMGNLLSSIPPRLYEKYNIQGLIYDRTQLVNKLTEELNSKINPVDAWSLPHKEVEKQTEIKKFNTETYQIIANKVTAIIDELYIESEERKAAEEKLKEDYSSVRGIL